MIDSFHKSKLANGLAVLTARKKSASSATVLLMVGVGSRYEKKDKRGLSHFLEHMAFKGTKKYPTTLKISEIVEGAGGIFNAYTSRDHTVYWMKASAKHILTLFDILSDMVLNSLYKQLEIDREKGVITEEINMYEDTPMQKIEIIYEELLYGKDKPLGASIIGTKETVRSLQREDFLAYINTYYKPANTVLAAAGGVEHKKIMALAEKYFAKWQNAKTPGYKKAIIAQKQPQVCVVKKTTEQAHLCFGTHALSLKDKRKYVLSVLSAILGNGMSSRLFIDVRERKGLCYYIRSSANKYQDAGNFVTQSGVDPKKLKEAVKAVYHQYLKIAKSGVKGISDKEFARAKEFIKGYFVLSLEDSRAVADFFAGSYLLEGEIRTPQDVLKKIDQVKKEEVVLLAEELFQPEKMNLAVIGPFEKGIDEELKKMLK